MHRRPRPRIAPKTHAAWLQRESFSDHDISHLRRLTRSFTDHEDFMEDFLTIFAPLHAHGPGTEADRLAVLRLVPGSPSSILDIGCGPGDSTLLLAQNTKAHVHGLDNLDQSLEVLAKRAKEASLADRITPVNASMDALPFDAGSLDVIWCENTVYVMGFEAALANWKPFLSHSGTLVVSDLVWLREDAPEDVMAFWRASYPGMANVAQRRVELEALGYDLVGEHTLSHDAWAAYYEPLAQRIEEVRHAMVGSEAVAALEAEIEVLKKQKDAGFSYVFFVLQPRR